jgi:hypothetical protein
MLDQTLGEALGESLGEALGEALGLGVVETRSGERPGSRSQNLGTATTAKIKGKGRAAKRTDSLTPSFIHSLTHSSFRVHSHKRIINTCATMMTTGNNTYIDAGATTSAKQQPTPPGTLKTHPRSERHDDK